MPQVLHRRQARVRWGNLRRRHPFSRKFGFDRGQPIDRYYIEAFLAAQAADIRGRVLEIGAAEYTRRFGGARVTQSDVLHAAPGNPLATLVGDLCTGAGLPLEAFDCLILTQTLPFVYDVASAVATCRRILKPGGAVLGTLSGISQISRFDMDRWGDFWRFTDASARRLFGGIFGEANTTVVTYGNVLAATAFLHGLAARELTREELDFRDPDYQVSIGVRAVKNK
jgi:SAM-dependent methyltransferase